MSRKYERTEFNPQCDSVVTGPVNNIVANVSAHIYKNAPTHNFASHIKQCIEVNEGAHYYVRSAHQTAFTTASARIDLNNVSINPARRNGYICIGTITDGTLIRQCDIGLGYTNGAWRPYAYSKGSLCDGSSTGMGVALEKTDIVDVSVSISSSNSYDKISASFSIGGKQIAQASYTKQRGQIFQPAWGSELPQVRFMRFISLVPIDGGTADDKDNSTLSATMTNLKIGGQNWNFSNIEYAWSVQGANILSLSFPSEDQTTTCSDTISIMHRYQLH